MSISLIFTPGLRIGGEVIRGDVELRFPQVLEDEIEEVHVKLRGSVYAKVARNYYNQYHERRERIETARENVSVWTRGSAFPPPGSQVLRVPFQFELPIDVQPSCQYSGFYKHAHVGYSIEAVGVRPGKFIFNRRVMKPFPVVAPDAAGAGIKRSLTPMWCGDWTSIKRSDNIRRGLWGGYSNVKMELQIPAINIFPLFTPIPITLQVTTLTKQMKFDESGENASEAMFPAPPLHAKEVDFSLRRYYHLNAQEWTASGSETVSYLGGMGKEANGQDAVIIENAGKIWIPSEDDKRVGSWKQEVTMRSKIELKWTPTFETRIFSVRHQLRIKVGFPGIGNNLEAEFPILIKSGMERPADIDGSSGSAAPPYVGPPPELDLPPAYWTATNWGDGDEKGGGSSLKS